ncbi:uncharacterized protein LOC112599430 [Melanaphis sacchari]|uniref:uncharacterized protein LOC112599430 n=1 Tax=Melanaphis sacchari TaxID=742174 RepID=UPI000DC12D23|nr:uncharacterized protein LOC112599430 [Melanaphis sacchari]
MITLSCGLTYFKSSSMPAYTSFTSSSSAFDYLLQIDDWENFNRPGDWKLKKSKYSSLSNFISQRFMLDLILNLKKNLTCQYVNRIEFLIIRYRFHQKYTHNQVVMYGSLIDALSEPVITPEDRLRNLEAHELFSMFLMERNKIAITKAKKIGANQAYYKYSRNPRLCKIEKETL